MNYNPGEVEWITSKKKEHRRCSIIVIDKLRVKPILVEDL